MFAAKKKGVIIAKKEKGWWIFVLIKIVFLFLVAGLVILGGVYYTKNKSQEQIDLVEEISPEETVEKTINLADKELEKIKDNFRERITNLTPKEKKEIANASSVEEVKKIFSAALTTRIIGNFTRCVLDKDGHIYVIKEKDEKDKWIDSERNWTSNEEITPYYGIGLFSENDYRKIRTFFLAEIEWRPKKWEIVEEENKKTGLKERGKIRTHSWQGFKFTEEEEERISEKIVANEELIPVLYLGIGRYGGIPEVHVFSADTYHENVPVGLLFIENDNPSLPNNLIEERIYLFTSTFQHIFLVEINNSLVLYYKMDNPDFSLREKQI